MNERIEIDGVGLAYKAQLGGVAPAIVFVHGLGGSSASWRGPSEAAAAAGFGVVAPDLRGAGDSDKPPGPYSVELWAADLIALLDALEIERAVLAGHSLGCMVAQHAALELGERCLALAFLGCARVWGPGFGEVLAERAELARQGRMREVAEAVAAKAFSERTLAGRPELVAGFIEEFAANDPGGYAWSALAAAAGAMRELERIRAPVLAFAGSEDEVTPLAGAREIAAAVPVGVTASVEGGAHWCLIEDPAAVAGVLLNFLHDQATG